MKMKKSKDGYPEADRVMKNGMLIGCHQGLNKEMLAHLEKSIDLFISSKA